MINFTERTRKLLASNPPAVSDNTGDYLERPSDGWVTYGKYFDGIGYHGTTVAALNCDWFESKAGLGHIPPSGYG